MFEIVMGIDDFLIQLVKYWMRLMSKQSWVSVRSEKQTGKGRPINIYSLVAPVDEILSYYENKIDKESQAIISIIKKLKVMSKKVPYTLSN